jgi:hypothetical protein
MSERITAKQVEGLFKTFAQACGKHLAKSHSDVGGWQLDYNSAYGGWMILEITNESGGATDPMGSTRRPTTEMWYTMQFALRTIEACRGRGASFRRGRGSRRSRR